MNNLSEPISTQQTPGQVDSSLENSHNSKVIPFIIVAVLLILVGAGSYVLGTKKSQPAAENIAQTTPIPSPVPTIGETTNWKTYTNSQYKYSLKYPADWENAECSSTVFGPDVVSTCDTDSAGILRVTITDGIKNPLISIDDEFKVVERKNITIDKESGEWVYLQKVRPAPGADKIIIASVGYSGKTY